VRAAVAKLVGAGFLTTKKRGFQASNHFQLSFQSVTTVPDCKTPNPSPPCPSIRHRGDGQSVTTVPPEHNKEHNKRTHLPSAGYFSSEDFQSKNDSEEQYDPSAFDDLPAARESPAQPKGAISGILK
jgi:hypothetical protein